MKYPRDSLAEPDRRARPTSLTERGHMNRETIALIAASGGLAVIALIVSVSMHSRLKAMRRALSVLQGSSRGKNLVDTVAEFGKDLRLFENGVNRLIERQDELAAALSTTVRNVAVVRYDAFEDMGGRLSFSAALVDDHGNGLVLSAISGRMEARAYAKIVEEGESELGLSPEAQRAIEEALSGRKRSRAKVKARR